MYNSKRSYRYCSETAKEISVLTEEIVVLAAEIGKVQGELEKEGRNYDGYNEVVGFWRRADTFIIHFGIYSCTYFFFPPKVKNIDILDVKY